MNTSSQTPTSHASSSSSTTIHPGSTGSNGHQVPVQYLTGNSTTRSGSDAIRYIKQHQRPTVPAVPPPPPPLPPPSSVSQRGQTRQDIYYLTSENEPARPLNIPSSVRAGLYDKSQTVSQPQYIPPQQGPPSYPQPYGQPQPGHPHHGHLNYRYDNGQNGPPQVPPPPPPPPQPSYSRQHQEYIQQMQPQHQQQRSQLPPTPPLHSPPLHVQPVRSPQDYSPTTQRTNGYPSPVEQQHPRSASGSGNAIAAPSQSHSYFHPQPPPQSTQGPYPAPMHGPTPPPPPPPPSKSAVSGGNPMYSRPHPQPESQRQLAPPVPPTASGSAPGPSSSGSSACSAPDGAPGSTVAAKPIQLRPIDPLVIASTNAALDPIQRGIESLWSDCVTNVRTAMSKMHQDFTVLANRERHKNVELLSKVSELDKTLQTTLGELDVTSRELQRVTKECGEAERKVEELASENEGLVKENEVLRREGSSLKGALGQASKLIIALKREYEKAKAAGTGEKTDLGPGPSAECHGENERVMTGLIENGFDLDRVISAVEGHGPNNVVGHANKDLASLATRVNEGDAESILGYMSTVLGAVGEEVSRQMNMKMNVIMDEMEVEKTKRIRAQEKLEEVEKNLHFALPFLDRRKRTSSIPHSRVTSPEPMSPTSPIIPQGPNTSSPLPSSLQQRSVSSDSGIQKRIGQVSGQPRSFSASNATPTSSSSQPPHEPLQAQAIKRSDSSQSSLGSVPPPPSSSSRLSSSTSVGLDRDSSPEEESRPNIRITRDSNSNSNSIADSPLPTPPPSRAKDNTFGGRSRERDRDKDKDGDEMMDWRPSGHGAGDVTMTNSASAASRQQQQQPKQKEKPPIPVAFRSSPLIGPPKAAPPPPVNAKRTTSSGDVSLPSSRCAAPISSASETQSHSCGDLQSPSQSPHLGKRGRAEYEKDSGVGAGESESGRATPAVRMKLDPELEEEQTRRSLSLSSSVSGQGAGAGAAGTGGSVRGSSNSEMRAPTDLPKRPSATIQASSSSLSVASQSSSRSREEGELTPRSVSQFENTKKRKSRASGDEYEEGEVVERTPSVTATPTPVQSPTLPTMSTQQSGTGMRARVRIRPELLSRLVSPPPPSPSLHKPELHPQQKPPPPQQKSPPPQQKPPPPQQKPPSPQQQQLPQKPQSQSRPHPSQSHYRRASQDLPPRPHPSQSYYRPQSRDPPQQERQQQPSQVQQQPPQVPQWRSSQDRPPGPTQKPPAKLGIKHMEMLYSNENNSLTCRMCLTRKTSEPGQLRSHGKEKETDKERGNHNKQPVSIKRFSANASWDELVSHCYSEHPTACAELEKLPPSQIEERKQRMLAHGPRVAR